MEELTKRQIYYRKNKEKEKLARKKYYQKNKAKQQAYGRKYYSEHVQQVANYDFLNREKINANKRIWNKKNKDKRNESRNKSRTKEKRRIETAILRATGGVTTFGNQKFSTIKSDIKIIKKELGD